MLIENNSQYENITNENNEKNKIKLYLEACLRRKVENSNVILFKDRKEPQKNEISYKVWLFSQEIIKDARSVLNRTNEYNPIKQKSDVIKFKLGQIDIEEIKKEQTSKSTNNAGTENEYTMVLAQIYIGKTLVHLIENSDAEKGTSDIYKFSSAEKSDCFYLYRNMQNVRNEHWFAVRDPSRIVYQALVKFTVNEDDIQCSNPSCKNSKVIDMIYCHNDKKYFCAPCDEEIHNKSGSQILRKHRRVNYMTFSVTYQGSCINHSLKPYEFYCLNCKAIYCIKCLNEGEHSNIKDHDIKFISEIIGSIDNESKSLHEHVKQINSTINLEMEEKEKNSKELQKMINLLETSVYDRKRKAIQDLESETLYRSTYLASLYIELQRQIWEIENKISFLKNQYHHADNATYLNMKNVFEKYMSEDVFNNIEKLLSLNLDNITHTLYKLDSTDGIFKMDKSK